MTKLLFSLYNFIHKTFTSISFSINSTLKHHRAFKEHVNAIKIATKLKSQY